MCHCHSLRSCRSVCDSSGRSARRGRCHRREAEASRGGCGAPFAKSTQLHDVVSPAFGERLDIVINNAAHMEPNVSFLELDPEVYRRTWEVNIRGLLNMARAFLPMQLSTRASAGGLCTMINLASSGVLSIRPGGASYRSSKLAVPRWTESL